MTEQRLDSGSLLAALGAVVLAVAVFLPWYGISLSASAAAAVQQLDAQIAAQLSIAAPGGEPAAHGVVAGLATHPLASESAHQALSHISVALLVLAGLAIALALLALARAPAAPGFGHGAVAPLGAVAGVLVLYRIVHPPLSEVEGLALSVREGAWLALGGAIAIIAGGMWPGRARAARAAEVPGAWSQLSGWTPDC
jgi:hypothetical protein